MVKIQLYARDLQELCEGDLVRVLEDVVGVQDPMQDLAANSFPESECRATAGTKNRDAL